MHRLKRWINEEVSFYKEQLKESPLQTIAIYLSWVFVIIIGLMAVFAYIKFIIDGGYPMSVARVKENGAFASANFTSGTTYIISNNVVWIILAIIICIQTLVSIILMFAEKVIWKWILFIIDIIAMVFCVVKISTNYNYLANHDMGLIYAAVLLSGAARLLPPRTLSMLRATVRHGQTPCSRITQSTALACTTARKRSATA